ncbi:NACHT domain-containing protein, partial [Phialemonium atrogriseum]
TQTSSPMVPTEQPPSPPKTPPNLRQTPTSSLMLWDRAYDSLKLDEPTIMQKYEMILSCQIERSSVSETAESQANIIAQDLPDKRRDQMKKLVVDGQMKTAREAEIKETTGTVLRVVTQTKSLIDVAVQAVPQAALPWSIACIAIKMLTNSVETTESHRKGLTHVISRMDWYWALAQSLLEPSHASGTRLGLENQIVDLYRKLLLYQIRSICSFFGKRGVVFMRDLIQFDGWEGQLESIRNAEDQFRHDTMTYSMLRQYSGFEEIRHQLAQLAEGVEFQAEQLAHQCMKDLLLTDPELDKKRIEDSKGDLLPGAYRWVLKDSNFRQWRDGSGSQLLWVKGDPGKGKTMLLCGIIDELRPAVQLTKFLVAHFFCQATEARLNRASGVLRGLIYMLAKKQPSLVSHIQKHHQDAGQKLFEGHNAWFALQGILQDMLHNLAPNTTTYLVIDALDECKEDLPQLLINGFPVANNI